MSRVDAGDRAAGDPNGAGVQVDVNGAAKGTIEVVIKAGLLGGSCP